MFLRRKPSDKVINQFISSQQDLPFSYEQVGATKSQPRDLHGDYIVDHNRIMLGEGEETYRRAVAALRSWHQFDLGWVTVVPPGKPVEAGTTVAVLANVFGFCYGTLPDHIESGEERFTVEWCTDDSVWYDLYAFSRPKHPLVRIGFPITRMLQKRFVRDSLAVMGAAVNKLATA